MLTSSLKRMKSWLRNKLPQWPLRRLKQERPVNLLQWASQAQRRLPLSPQVLKSRSSNNLRDPRTLRILDASYRALPENAAWQDFQGRLQTLKEEIERQILTGGGPDQSLRAAYGVLLEVIAWPEFVHREFERQKNLLIGQVSVPNSDGTGTQLL